MRRHVTTLLPSYASTDRLASPLNVDLSPTTNTVASTRWWVLLCVALGCYTLAVLSFFQIPWILKRSSQYQQVVTQSQQPVLAHSNVAMPGSSPANDAERSRYKQEEGGTAKQGIELPMRDGTQPRVRRSNAFYKALDLVHLSKTKSSNSVVNEALLSEIRNNSDQSVWSMAAFQQDFDRLEGLKREALEEMERLKILVGAADKLIAEEEDAWEDTRAGNLVDIRLSGSRKLRENLKCVGWRQTRHCRSNGERERHLDRSCIQVLQSGVSGYCEMLDEDTGENIRVMELNCTSIRDDVQFTCAEANGFVRYGSFIHQVYDNAVAQNASDPLKLLGNQGEGNGIVILVDPKALSSVFALISVLRSYNCTLSIELWALESEFDRRPKMTKALELLLQRLSNVTVETIVDPRITRSYMRVYAVQHSKFQNILFLDTDNVPAQDPTFLFESSEFLEHGAIFWPDLWHPENSLFNIQHDSLLWQLIDLPFVDMFEQESGQLLINRKRAAIALEVLTFFAYDRSSLLNRLELVNGDKDLFRLAWMITNTPFYMMPFPPGLAGPGHGVSDIKFCGMTTVQFDFNGKVLFLRRNAMKRNGKVDKKESKFWIYLLSFNWKGEGENTSVSTDKTLVHRTMSYEVMKQKYQIGFMKGMPHFKHVKSCYAPQPYAAKSFTLTKFDQLPFAMLEQQLLDYAHEGALLMKQAQGLMGN